MMSSVSGQRPIYLDYNSTTPVDAAVTEAMLPWLRAEFGNPSSQHAYGRVAHDAVARARMRTKSSSPAVAARRPIMR
jgi:cysteine desulfurase